MISSLSLLAVAPSRTTLVNEATSSVPLHYAAVQPRPPHALI
jgi:hypothetical protein